LTQQQSPRTAGPQFRASPFVGPARARPPHLDHSAAKHTWNFNVGLLLTRGSLRIWRAATRISCSNPFSF